MTKSKLEKVLEYMVNGEKSLASEMLHEHLVETAREIYADLAEEDELEESDLELDEDEDLDEGYREDDRSGDFEDDIDGIENEIETEEYFSEEDEDEDEMDFDMDDGEGDMDMDMDDLDGEMDMDDLDGEMDMDDGETVVDTAMVNVEDALDELRAAFAEVIGDDEDDSMDDEEFDAPSDEEFDGEDDYTDDDEYADEEKFGEAAVLKKHAVKMSGDDDGKASPIKQNQPNISDKGKAVNFAKGDEKGGKGNPAKKMNVTGPQDQKGKMDKKVAKPSNTSEKAKSNIGS
jgi:hypothetical protein